MESKARHRTDMVHMYACMYICKVSHVIELKHISTEKLKAGIDLCSRK